MSLIEKKDANLKSQGDFLRVQFPAGRTGSDGVFIPNKMVGVAELQKDFPITGTKDIQQR